MYKVVVEKVKINSLQTIFHPLMEAVAVNLIKILTS